MTSVTDDIAITERSIWLQEPSVVAELRFNEDRIMNTPTV